MRLVEFYKELQSILQAFHHQELDEDGAAKQIEDLKQRATDAGLEVAVKPEILRNIQIYEDEGSYDSYEEDGDNY